MPHICKICGSPLTQAFKTLVLGKHEATYNYCEECGFLCAENPHWLEEAYSSAIACTDTGLVARNVAIANQLAVILYYLMGERGNGLYVDVAGGYGMLTRLMRDYGFDFYWSDKYCQNLMALGFDYAIEMGACRAVTAFEVLEHTEDPINFVEEALRYGQTDTLIFTTELYEGKPPTPEQWWYYSFETGQHIAFFQRRTLQILASKLGLTFSSNGWLHIISKRKINEALLKAYTGRLSILVTRRIRKKLASHTMSDHNLIVNQLNRNNT
ncbi:MAG: class I SAM-dependent methyltransferase [Proteobacteria bacterium]|nr:class I SAM-dependent methyltransferase [Pseudomonadota bacterium]